MSAVPTLKYHHIDWVIRKLKEIDPDFGLNDLQTYVSEKLIHPIIYINSMPVNAFEYTEAEKGVAIGFCILSGNMRVFENNIIAIFDDILKAGKSLIRPSFFMSDFLEPPEIMSWSHESEVFDLLPKQVPCRPKEHKDSSIHYFILLHSKQVRDCCEIQIDNLRITHKDFNKIKYELMQINNHNNEYNAKPTNVVFTTEKAISPAQSTNTEKIEAMLADINRPSNKGKHKTKNIKITLEHILCTNPPEPLHPASLWASLIQSASDPKSPTKATVDKHSIEITFTECKQQYTKKKASSYLNEAIAWYNSHNNTIN